jgi:two-component system, cell cycle response regulator DivK
MLLFADFIRKMTNFNSKLNHIGLDFVLNEGGTDMENTTITQNIIDIEQYFFQDKTILIAEDIDLNYLYLFEILKHTGAKLVRAENGKTALDFVKSNDVDIILMDLLMPVMNGYEATRQIKAYKKDLPIIAQTAFTMTEDRKKALEAGCDDYIPKPIEKDILLQKMANLLITK